MLCLKLLSHQSGVLKVRLYTARPRTRTRFFVPELFARTTALIAPRANFVKSSRGFFCYLPISKYFFCIISTNRNVYVWLFQENLGTSVSLVFLVKFREEWTTQWARQNQWLLKLRRIMDCMTKHTICTHCAYKYRTMIFFVSNYTCTMISNDQIWYLKQVKDEPSRNPSTVFRVRVRALFEWQNRSKVAVAVRVGRVRVRAVYKRAFRGGDYILIIKPYPIPRSINCIIIYV